MSNIFAKEKDETVEAYYITDEILDKYDATLKRELTVLQARENRNEDTAMLHFHDTEARKLVAALREQVALAAYYKTRINGVQ